MTKIPQGASLVHKGILFDVYQKEVEQFDGSYKTFERIRSCDVVKAICVVHGKILIAHEEQPGTERIHSLLGGRIDAGENPDEAMAREVHEESGMVFSDITLLARIPDHVGALEGYYYYYICKNPTTFEAQQLDTGGEKIDLVYFTFEEFIDFLIDDQNFSPALGNYILRKYILPGKVEELRALLFS